MLTISLFAVLALSVPEPPPAVFTYGMTAGQTDRTTLHIAHDGSWSGSGAAGQLTPDELTTLRTAIDKSEFKLLPRSTRCSARPAELEFVTTSKGRLVFGRSCAPAAHESVLGLVLLAESLTTRRPAPILIRLERWRTGQDDKREVAVVMRSGQWTTHRGRGELSKEALKNLVALIDAALIEAPPTPMAPVCKGDFPHELDVPGRGEAKWIWPCHKPSESLAKALDALYAAVGFSAP